jgi:hypothetical protein
MLDWDLGMVEGAAGEHRSRLSPADGVTLLRLGLLPLIATQTSRPRDAIAFTSPLAAAASDLADGALARGHGPIRLGRDLDTVADVLVGLAYELPGGRVGFGRLPHARSGAPSAARRARHRQLSPHRPAPAASEVRRDALDRARSAQGLTVSPAAPRAANRLITVGSPAAFAVARPSVPRKELYVSVRTASCTRWPTVKSTIAANTQATISARLGTRQKTT